MAPCVQACTPHALPQHPQHTSIHASFIQLHCSQAHGGNLLLGSAGFARSLSSWSSPAARCRYGGRVVNLCTNTCNGTTPRVHSRLVTMTPSPHTQLFACGNGLVQAHTSHSTLTCHGRTSVVVQAKIQVLVPVIPEAILRCTQAMSVRECKWQTWKSTVAHGGTRTASISTSILCTRGAVRGSMRFAAWIFGCIPSS